MDNHKVNGTKSDSFIGIKDELDISGISKENIDEIWISTFPSLSKNQLKKFKKLIFGKFLVYGTRTK